MSNPSSITVDTAGGDYAEGNINKTINVTTEVAYDVSGLANPYLGLAAFTYELRSHYGGRSAMINATVEQLTTPGAQQALLFVTGASGAGKSSFVLAGLVPALEQFYQQRNLTVRHASMKPGARPLAALADALLQLGLTPGEPFAAAQPLMIGVPSTKPNETSVSLLVIDQFDELFTQSDAAQRDGLFAILATLPPFATLRMHVICSMRTDYLPELFPHSALYNLTKHGAELRVMTELELCEAIQQPLLAEFPDGSKRFEAALVEQLAAESAGDASYLPLLQVTLRELWRAGKLTLAAYAGHDLTYAIRARADTILSTDPAGQPHSQAKQNAMLDIFLDLVHVSIDEEQVGRDARRRRMLSDLIEGRPERLTLIEELVQARLLSRSTASGDPPIEFVDIIHERLIVNWDRLRSAIKERRSALRQRARFEQALGEWQAASQSREYLLVGVRLAEAELLASNKDIALQGEAAATLLQQSIAAREAERQQELQQAQALAEAQQKRLETERQARAQLRKRAILLGAALIGAIISLVAAVWLGIEADRRRTLAESQSLAFRSRTLPDPELALLIATEAARQIWDRQLTASGRQVEESLRTALRAPRVEQTLHGHTGYVSSAAWSPDGKQIVTASADETARIWDAASGTALRSLTGHSDEVRSAAWSPDGKQIVTASADGTARIWDAASGTALRSLTGHSELVSSAAWSPDGKQIVTASADGSARIWDAASGAQLRLLEGHTDVVNSAAWSPDGKQIVTTSADWTARIWDTASGMVLRTLSGHTGSLNSAAWSPDGTQIVTSSEDQTARVWDATTGNILLQYTGHTAFVFDAQWSHDGGAIISSSGDRTAQVWDAATGRQLRLLGGHTNSIYSGSFSPDDNHLLTASYDQTVRIWGAVIDTELFELVGHTDVVYKVAFSPDSKQIATASADQTARIWDAATGTELRVLEGHSAAINALAFSPDSKQIVTASDDQTVRIWDASSGAVLRTLAGHTASIRSVAYSPDGQQIATASDDQTVRIWDASSGAVLRTLAGHTASIRSVAYSPDGQQIATASDDRTVRIWDASSGVIVRTLEGHTDSIWSVAYSPDGRRIASGSIDQTVRIWDAKTGTLLMTLFGNTSAVVDLAWRPDGKQITSVSWDDTVRLWDAATGTELRTITTKSRGLSSVSYRPDGKWIVTAGWDRAAKVFYPDFGCTLTLAERRATRQLTAEERRSFGLPESTPAHSRDPGAGCPGLPPAN